jgi:hypothetical protein
MTCSSTSCQSNVGTIHTMINKGYWRRCANGMYTSSWYVVQLYILKLKPDVATKLIRRLCCSILRAWCNAKSNCTPPFYHSLNCASRTTNYFRVICSTLFIMSGITSSSLLTWRWWWCAMRIYFPTRIGERNGACDNTVQILCPSPLTFLTSLHCRGQI